jgi:hypothetical protein
LVGNAAEDEQAQVRLNLAEDGFRQIEPLGQPRRQAIRADKFN